MELENVIRYQGTYSTQFMGLTNAVYKTREQVQEFAMIIDPFMVIMMIIET